MEFLTDVHIAWLPAMLQMMGYMFILFTVAIVGWWGSIVVSDLYKRLKTGVRKWTAQ